MMLASMRFGPSERGRRPNLQNGCPAERGRPEIHAVEHQAEPAGTELFLVPSRGSQPSPDIGSPRAASPDGAGARTMRCYTMRQHRTARLSLICEGSSDRAEVTPLHLVRPPLGR